MYIRLYLEGGLLLPLPLEALVVVARTCGAINNLFNSFF